MAGIQLIVELDDKGTPKIRKLEEEVDGFGKQSKKTGSSWKKTWKGMGDSVASVHKRVRSFATSMPALIGAAGLAGSFGALMKSGIGFNAQLESISTQFGVIFRDADKTKRVMAEIVKFSAATPFQLGEVAEAAKTLTAFGLEGTSALRTVGDAAAAAQTPITELASTFGKIASGQTGEAFNRLAELGLVTRSMLEGEGLVFDKGGSYVGSAEDAMDAVFRVVNSRFSGMMEKMSLTWNGAWSTMKDSFGLFLGAVSKPLFEDLKPILAEVSKSFGEMISSGSAAALGARISAAFKPAIGAVTALIKDLPNLDTRIRRAWDGLGMLFGGLVASMGSGWKWLKGVTRAFFDWLVMKGTSSMLDLSVSIVGGLIKIGDRLRGQGNPLAEAIASIFPDESALTGLKYMKAGADMLDSAASGLLDNAIGRSGALDTMKNNFSDISAMWSAPIASPSVDPGVQSTGGWESENARRAEAQSELLTHLFDLEAQHAAMMKDLWRNYYEEMIDVAAVDFMDAFASTILDRHSSLAENLEASWKRMKETFVRSAFDMAAGWIASQVKMAIVSSSVKKAAAIEEVATGKLAAIAAKQQAGSAASAGAAKYHMAYAAIPFAGPGIAAAAISAMNAQILASQAMAGAAAFRTGGLIPGYGSGIEDDQLHRMSGGEYVQPKAAVDQYGQRFMEEVRTGTYKPSSGGDVHLHIDGGGNSDFERDVEEQLVPVVERLFRQRRLRFS